MASIGSVSAMKSSVLLHSGTHHPLRFSFSTSRMRKSIGYGSNEYSAIRCLKIVGEDSAASCLWCERLGVGCSRRHGWRIKCVGATGKDSVEGDSDEESEDAIQATMEKSKRVLAMQRDLLQQVFSSGSVGINGISCFKYRTLFLPALSSVNSFFLSNLFFVFFPSLDKGNIRILPMLAR